MKFKTMILVAAGFTFGLMSNAEAGYSHYGGCGSGDTGGECVPGTISTYTFDPVPADLYDLPHGYYFKWGITWDVPTDETIVGATLTFSQIRNYNNDPNVLFVNLLDNAMSGVHYGMDGYQSQGDYFDSLYGGTDSAYHSSLVDFFNISSTASNIVYDFSSTALGTLTSYLNDGVFGLGFDPDCHFYNCGISLQIKTLCEGGPSTPVPEPATMLLLGTGLAGLAGLRSKRKKMQA